MFATNKTYHGLIVTLNGQIVGRIQSLALKASVGGDCRWDLWFAQAKREKTKDGGFITVVENDEVKLNDFNFKVAEIEMHSRAVDQGELFEIKLAQPPQWTELPWGFKWDGETIIQDPDTIQKSETVNG